MLRLAFTALAATTALFALAAFADPGETRERELARLRDDYYRLIKSDPAAAFAARDRHAALVNASGAQPPFFSYLLGSQWPGALNEEKHPSRKGRYSQLQACEIMVDAGSDILKISPSKKNLLAQGVAYSGPDTLDAVARHPFYDRILALPYRVMLFWAHGGGDRHWHGRSMSDNEKRELHREFYALTRHLLTRFQGSGKTFLLGNWEGDWMAGGYDIAEKTDIPDERLAAYAEWLDIRTRAIDEAKADTPHSGVQVFSYLEINHTRCAREKGLRRLVNEVLPRSRVDYVSLSSYDFQGFHSWPAPRTADSLRAQAFANLDYVESMLPPRPIAGKRVFIGEIGYTWEEIAAKERISLEDAKHEQVRLALAQARVNIEWGTPLWLWWATFSSHEGTFGLVDNHTGAPSPLHGALQEYYRWSRDFVDAQKRRRGVAPSAEEFRTAALRQLDLQLSRL